MICHVTKARETGKRKVVAREDLGAYKKDVTAKCVSKY